MLVKTLVKTSIALCLMVSLAACSDGPPDRSQADRTDPAPRITSPDIATPEATATRDSGTSESAERTVVERTVDGTIFYEDESVLRIDQAELLRSKEGDEIFVRATIMGPSENKDCFLMRGKTWFALREAIEGGDLSEAPEVLETFWADDLSTEKLSSGDTYAVSFRQDPQRKGETSDPSDTPFFALCYMFADSAGESSGDATWYDVAHVKGTPRPS